MVADFLLIVPDNAILLDIGKITCSVDVSSKLADSHRNIHVFRWQNGKGEIEYIDGTHNRILTDSGEVADEYAEIVELVTDQRQEALRQADDARKTEEARQKTWGYHRATRDAYLGRLDLTVLRTLESGDAVPETLKTLRHKLRGLPETNTDPTTVDWTELETEVRKWTG